ncbi:MAG: hypothetical protein QM687_14785 [Ferruginibacter sp.]
MKAYYYYIIFFLAIGLGGCMRSNMPELRETYSMKDTNPFGGYVAHAIFKEVYQDKIININKKPFDQFRDDTYADDGSLYMSISKKFYCSREEASDILEFVKDGHSFFLGAAYIDTLLLEKISCRQSYKEWTNMVNESKYDVGSLSLAPLEGMTKNTFSYYYFHFNNSFVSFDSSHARVLGYNQQGAPNFIVLFLGKGRLYLHCDPRAFSNYFLLKNDNYLYMKQVMQIFKSKPGNVFWDDYYNKINYKNDNDGDGRSDGGSALSVLFQYRELTIAFWILMLLLLLYIFFNGKRRQRIINDVPPVENTSIAYTQAIAGLYLAEKNNKTIAEKMITYFNDFVRSHYFLSIHNNKDLSHSLSKKSGIALEKIQALYNTMEQVQLTEDVSDFELLTLNEQIQYFYKNRN